MSVPNSSHPAYPSWVTTTIDNPLPGFITIGIVGYYAGGRNEFELFIDTIRQSNETLKTELK